MSAEATMRIVERRRLGRTGYELSVIGVGGWLGMLYEPGADQAARDAAGVEGVRRGISLGINYFDTAPMYANGIAEQVLGAGLKALSPAERRSIYVSTKVGFGPERPN